MRQQSGIAKQSQHSMVIRHSNWGTKRHSIKLRIRIPQHIGIIIIIILSQGQDKYHKHNPERVLLKSRSNQRGNTEIIFRHNDTQEKPQTNQLRNEPSFTGKTISKYIDHGWASPLTIKYLQNIINVGVMTLGVVKQLSINEKGNAISKDAWLMIVHSQALQDYLLKTGSN